MSHTDGMTTAASPSGPRARDADATRADLLHAAMRRFTVLGYERTTTRDIAKDAQVNVSLINRYFGSKDGLFAAVMRESATSIAQSVPDEPADFVDGMLRSMTSGTRPEFGNEHPLLLLLRDVGEEQVRELRRRGLSGVITGMKQQVSRDEQATTHDAALSAELLLAFIAGVITIRTALPKHALATTDPEQLRPVLTHIVSAILSIPAGGDPEAG
jgi:AcrR family transcriptional regulator